MPIISFTPQASGPPGGRVTVEGLVFVEDDPVEIRWNSVDGPLLGTGVGPNFSVEMTVPNDPPGLYTVIAFTRPPGGSVGFSGTASFQVTPVGAAGRDGATVTTSGPSFGGEAAVADRSSKRSSTGGTSTLALAVGGAGLLALGGFMGASLAKRRLRGRETVDADQASE